MTTQAQKDTLAQLVGRPLTEEELVKLEPLVDVRNDVGIAALLSAGRTKYGPTAIGPGTIISVAYPNGGAMLNALQTLGQTDPNVYWGMDPVRRGALDLSIPAARTMLEGLKAAIPEYSAELDKVLAVGLIPDPITVDTVSIALNRI